MPDLRLWPGLRPEISRLRRKHKISDREDSVKEELSTRTLWRFSFNFSFYFNFSAHDLRICAKVIHLA
jgi:hypothetical protein